MTQSPQILLPINGVEDHRAGIAFAAQEARRRGAAVRVVHVMTPALPFFPVTSDVGLDGEEVRRLGATAVDRAADAVREALAGADLPVTTEVLRGTVIAAVVDASEGADLVVLVRRHPRPTPPLSAMSAVHGVAARAHAPVAVVPLDWEADRGDAPVVVGVEGEESRDALRAGLAHARRCGARVELVHGWWYTDAYDGLVFAGEAEAAETRRQRERLDLELGPLLAEHPDVETTLVIAHARPAELLIGASERARLVVVGRHHPLLPIGSHLGPITRVVLRESACPVLVEADPDADHG